MIAPDVVLRAGNTDTELTVLFAEVDNMPETGAELGGRVAASS